MSQQTNSISDRDIVPSVVISESRNPTHRVLACCDILEELFQHLQAGVDLEPRPTLSRLARVNRAFNAVFTRKLWETLPSIVPLLRVLSTLQVVEFRRPARRKEYVLGGPIASDEWSRCLYLASFVRCLRGGSSMPVTPSVWMYIAILLGERSLLPSVRELHWDIVSSTSVELSLLVSSSLRKLSLTFKGYDHDQHDWTAGLLALLRNIVPRMISLSQLHLYGLQSEQLSSVISPIGSLDQLTCLEVRDDAPADLNVLKMLSRMNSLSDLTLSVDLDNASSAEFHGFASLRRINIINESIPADTLIKLLASFRSQKVTDFTVNNEGGMDWSTQELLEFFKALAERCPMLEKLSASVCLHDAPRVDAAIAPLTRIRSLREVDLNISGHPPIAFSDTLFYTLASSWLRIVSLRLLSTDADGYVSLLMLLAFAKFCPELRELCIPVLDLSPEVGVEDLSVFPIRDHGLKILRVQYWSGEDDKNCALFLDRVFPTIDVKASHAPDDDWECGPEWDRMLDEALGFCQLSRRNRQPQTDAKKAQG